jgi:excisionase family DNA binding protein
MEQQERLLRVSEVCTQLGLGERHVRQLIADGRLAAVRLRGLRAVRVPASALEQLIEDRRHGRSAQ